MSQSNPERAEGGEAKIPSFLCVGNWLAAASVSWAMLETGWLLLGPQFLTHRILLYCTKHVTPYTVVRGSVGEQQPRCCVHVAVLAVV